jgi:hypothetical protein
MLAVSQGQEIDLSTRWGMRGWFWSNWCDDELHIRRFKVTWQQCPRQARAKNSRRCLQDGRTDFVIKEPTAAIVSAR